jgi:hypothetical protein
MAYFWSLFDGWRRKRNSAQLLHDHPDLALYEADLQFACDRASRIVKELEAWREWQRRRQGRDAF